MQLFPYDAWDIDSANSDSENSSVRSDFVPALALAIIRALFGLYTFATIIVAYSWLAHGTATFRLKDINIASYTVQQSKEAIGQTFSFFSMFEMI